MVAGRGRVGPTAGGCLVRADLVASQSRAISLPDRLGGHGRHLLPKDRGAICRASTPRLPQRQGGSPAKSPCRGKLRAGPRHAHPRRAARPRAAERVRRRGRALRDSRGVPPDSSPTCGRKTEARSITRGRHGFAIDRAGSAGRAGDEGEVPSARGDAVSSARAAGGALRARGSRRGGR